MEIIIFLLSYLTLEAVLANPDTPYFKLRGNLLRNYNKSDRPVVNNNHTIVVRLAFVPRHILGLDDKTRILTIEGMVRLEWTDEHLTWKTEENNNITQIHLTEEEIWKPDVVLYHMLGAKWLNEQESLLFVHNDGRISWNPEATFEISCQEDFKYFPYDTHLCSYVLGSWSYDGDEIFLQKFDENRFQLTPEMITGDEWKMSRYFYETLAYEKSHPDYYPTNFINFTMEIRRTTSMYKLTTVMPLLSNTLMTVGSFWLELWDTPRYVMAMANYVLAALHLLSLSVSIPSSGSTPIIAQLSSASVCLTVLLLLETTLLDYAGRRQREIPEKVLWLTKAVPDKLLNALIPFPLGTESAPDDSEATGQETEIKDASRTNWRLICLVFDRLFLYAFIVAYVIVDSLLLFL